MASAVQTKKKRDKRKRKEDGPEEFIPQPSIITPTLADDLNIHLHKEATTGGGLCAKLVFFVLLTILSTLIGLIITEHRGLTDLDTIKTESAFAHIFEGWIEKFPDPHEHEETLSVEHSQEDEEGDDADEHDHSSHHDDNESDDLNELSEEENSQTVSDEEKEEYDATQEDEEEEQVQQDEEDDDEELETRETDSVTQEESDIPLSDTPEDQETAEEVTNTEEKYEVSDSVESKEDDTEIETARLRRPDSDEMKAEENADEEPENRSEETMDSSEKELPEKIQTEDVDETVKESSNMVVRFGVGTALLIVAHVVLIKKWRSAKISVNQPEGGIQDVQVLDLTRRNTIVLPPDLDKIERDYEKTEEDYSEDEECKTKEERALDSSALRQEYQQLRSAYSHNLSPDWIPREMYNNSEEGEEEEDEDEPDEEEDEEECEEEEEADRSDEDDEIISESEDAELLRRLQERYGALHQDEDEEEEEELEEDEEEEYEEDGSTNYDHWKRKTFVPIEDSDSEDENSWANPQSSGQTNYDFSNITNTNDWKIRDELDRAGHNLKNDAAYALTLFNQIVENYPASPRALYGRAQSLDLLAEQKRSNKFLEAAIDAYEQTLVLPDVTDVLFIQVADRCINRLRFRGNYKRTISIHKSLILKFPENVDYQNELAVTYLTMNNFYEAKKVLHDILLKWPNDGFAMVNYGFILKRYDLSLKEAVKYLKKGISTRDPGVIDGRFYYHLGDALIRLGRNEEAMAIHIDGVNNKVFLSKYQRSLHNVDRLTGRPWWKKEQLSNAHFFKRLEEKWTTIRDEGLSLLDTDGLFKSESEDLREVGDWKQFELYARGVKNQKN
ncbi:aspartyl/asparaginyl beta-hydroxylase isoform X3 [Photinus pyralis]|nr:aspartyl/asparaginyl beta-hydroxylase isoform X3 [Photinus pyralis]